VLEVDSIPFHEANLIDVPAMHRRSTPHNVNTTQQIQYNPALTLANAFAFARWSDEEEASQPWPLTIALARLNKAEAAATIIPHDY
jgi:hypothetical protein